MSKKSKIEPGQLRQLLSNIIWSRPEHVSHLPDNELIIFDAPDKNTLVLVLAKDTNLNWNHTTWCMILISEARTGWVPEIALAEVPK